MARRAKRRVGKISKRAGSRARRGKARHPKHEGMEHHESRKGKRKAKRSGKRGARRKAKRY